MDFTVRSSFILFAFTAYNASAWARSLERFCDLYVFVGFAAEVAFIFHEVLGDFPSFIQTPFILYIPQSSFLESPAGFTFRHMGKSIPYIGSRNFIIR